MIRLVVRQMHLEQSEVIVDRTIEPQLLHQQMHRADPTGGNRPSSVRDLVANVRCGKFRPRRRPAIDPLQPPGDSLLAVFSCLRTSAFTRNSSVRDEPRDLAPTVVTQFIGGFSVFLRSSQKAQAETRLAKV